MTNKNDQSQYQQCIKSAYCYSRAKGTQREHNGKLSV